MPTAIFMLFHIYEAANAAGRRGCGRTPFLKGVENEWFWRNATSCSSDYEVHNKSKRGKFCRDSKVIFMENVKKKL